MYGTDMNEPGKFSVGGLLGYVVFHGSEERTIIYAEMQNVNMDIISAVPTFEGLQKTFR